MSWALGGCFHSRLAVGRESAESCQMSWANPKTKQQHPWDGGTQDPASSHHKPILGWLGLATLRCCPVEDAFSKHTYSEGGVRSVLTWGCRGWGAGAVGTRHRVAGCVPPCSVREKLDPLAFLLAGELRKVPCGGAGTVPGLVRSCVRRSGQRDEVTPHNA